MDELREALYSTALANDLRVISTERCAQLLAWLYVHGGGCENAVFDKRLNADIRYAQQRAGLHGSEIPDGELARLISGYVFELEQNLKDGSAPPEFLEELKNDYKIRRTWRKTS